MTYILSVLLARFQLENRSAPARLGSKPSQLGLAQPRKFQLELISNNYSKSFWGYFSNHLGNLVLVLPLNWKHFLKACSKTLHRLNSNCYALSFFLFKTILNETKLFWTCPNCFGLVEDILDMIQKPKFSTKVIVWLVQNNLFQN